MKEIIIAIDGFSACGKSTTAKKVAEMLGYIFIDTGAMYRAVSLYLLEHGIDVMEVTPALQTALDQMVVEFRMDRETGLAETFLNGRNVEEAIRTPQVSAIVSEVAALSPVRRALVAQQQQMGKRKGIVMDGRDIGTVVFPDAELKIFMTASIECRIQRRIDQLAEKGVFATAEEVKENLLHRDHIDSTREDSPLRQAEDAILLDNTHLSFTDQVQFIVGKAREIMRETAVNC